MIDNSNVFYLINYFDVGYLSLLWALGIPCPLSVLVPQVAPQWLHVLSKYILSANQFFCSYNQIFSFFLIDNSQWEIVTDSIKCYFTSYVFHDISDVCAGAK